MSDEQTTTAEPAPDPVAQQFTEAALAEFRALKAEHGKTQGALAKLSEEHAALKRETLVKRFTDEVRGRSDESGTAWVAGPGGWEASVALLCDMAQAFGADSDQIRNYVAEKRAEAERQKSSDLYRAFGTARGGENTGAEARIDVAAEALMAAHPGMTRAQAVTRALTERPELFDAYERDRR